MCGAPAQGGSPESIDSSKETVISGRVVSGEVPVPGAYIRLLDADGEFTAEVVSSATGNFRFFARPGSWTLRALARQGTGEIRVSASAGQSTDTTITL
ncbi:MAG: DUF1416 domain-containing protein [Mycobacteriales bacterium]